ncbi:hypothetical protein Neosp_006313 [[Neocosmospora] mangrovei]
MNTLHAPTVPSGETSASITNGDAGHLSFAELERKKDDIEAELKALVRTTRARIIRLRNDYTALMTRIEKFLHEHFASLDENDAEPAPSSGTQPILPDSYSAPLDPPFAKVNTVAAGSPAESAGLKPGDEIRNFGYVNRANHDNLKKVAECVQGNEGSNIFIKVSRLTGVAEQQELRLTLTPRKDWGGRGMLGCHILPL